MIDAVDDAYPHPGIYPTKYVLGYVSGHTAHIWSDDEIAQVAKEGRVFGAIATARNASGEPPLTGQDGITDSRNMVIRLRSLGYRQDFPVFYDVEPGIFDLNPNGARAAIAQWKLGMTMAKWRSCWSYTVERQGGDWIATASGTRPLSIPLGKIGVQWGGNGTFDFDVFVNSLFPTARVGDMKAFLIQEGPGGSLPTPQYWVVAADLTTRHQVDVHSWNALHSTGQYLDNPGFDEQALTSIPIV